MNHQTIWSTARYSEGRPQGEADKRTAFEHDFDRLLFSTPVRRLADKTQVFPLERNDGVRTRLTHSHEVSNLARSIGNRLIRTQADCFNCGQDVQTGIPTILATVGLAHDLGNPPFGHQGEVAIRRWFSDNKVYLERFTKECDAENFQSIPENYRNDFLMFEGNAQTLRLLTCLQDSVGNTGLNLTAATLAAVMKYPVPSFATAKGSAATKKFGFFASEQQIIDWIRKETGLAEGQRHALTWLMEACDDTAYSILDVEDTIKKELVSPEDLRAYISDKFASNPEAEPLLKKLEDDFKKADATKTDLFRIREIKTSYIRTRLIEVIITGAAEEFLGKCDEIFAHRRTKPLLECGNFPSELVEALKSFSKEYSYKSSGVLRAELQGARVINDLMNFMWEGITHREKFAQPDSRRTTPRANYIYSKISSSYRWQFEQGSAKSRLPMRYREMQLLTDMISGMTDRFAVELHADLNEALHG